MAIEARSLFNIRALADNPPSQVGNQHRYGGFHEPLVLYIAKVPGSQDVFLTTMKPRQKVVTAQDVESSLYYCHLESSQDEEIRRASLLELDANSTTISEHSSDSHASVKLNSGIQRKPVPPPRNPQRSTEPIEEAESQSTRPGAGDDISVRLDNLQLHSVNSSFAEAPSQKLVGPRAPKQWNGLAGSIAPSLSASKENVAPGHPREQPPRLPPRRSTFEDSSFGVKNSMGPPPLPPRRNSELGGGGNVQEGEILPKLPARRRQTGTEDENGRVSKEYRNHAPQVSQFPPLELQKGFSVTLIRRDPSSGDQWNVGKITKGNETLVNPFGASNGHLGSNETSVSLEVYTPGYEKFATETKTDSYTEHQFGPAPITFTRHLNLQRQKDEPRSSSRSLRFRSSVDISSDEVAVNARQPPEPANTAQQLPPLSFMSPWSGVCKFETGLSGRTLTCRHFPSANPTVGARPPDSLESRLQNVGSSAVSELRFNLPTIKPSSPVKRRPPLSAGHSRSSFFSSSSSSSQAISSLSSQMSSTQWSSNSGRSRHGASRSYDGTLGHHRSSSGYSSHEVSRGGVGIGSDRLGPSFIPASIASRGNQDMRQTSIAAGGDPRHHHQQQQQHYGFINEEGQEYQQQQHHSYHGDYSNNNNNNDDDAGDGEALSSEEETSELEEMEMMDLSLGREHAGGGFGGKKAKLGKLIIQGEGLLMLDLVVAANMGVWWSGVERRRNKKRDKGR